MNLRTLAAIFVGAVFAVPTFSHAAYIHLGSVFAVDGTDKVGEDLYLAGSQVSVHGTSTGDVFVASGASDVSGVVTGDVFAAGRTLYVRGNVAGDVRVAGEHVQIGGTIAEDLIVFADAVEIEEGTEIGGSLLIRANYIDFEGAVAGAVDVAGSNVLFTCECNGAVAVEAQTSLTINPGTNIQGDLSYKAPHEAFFPEDFVVGGSVFYEEMEIQKTEETNAAIELLVKVILSAVGALLLFFLFPSFTETASSRVLANNGTLAVVGFIVLVCTPTIAILLLLSLVGVLPAVVLMLLYATSLIMAQLLAPVLAGAALALWIKKESQQRWYWVIAGSLVLALLTLIPVVGFIVRALVFLTALGVLMQLAYEYLWKRRKSQAPRGIEPDPEQVHDTHEEKQSTTSKEAEKPAETA